MLFTVSKSEEGTRLDKLLSLHFPQYSRSYFQYLIDENEVLINGQICKKREKPKEGDVIQVTLRQVPESALEAQDIPLEILYEDEFLLAINKPPGMVVHPAPGHPRGTFVNALLHHAKQIQNLSEDLRPGIVHRLDKETSGVLIAAKTTQAHQRLIELFSLRKICKTYLAICLGGPAIGAIETQMGRHPTKRQQMAVCATSGKRAITRIKTVTPLSPAPLTLVEVDLMTGRTHQIRVHLQAAKTPILGDPVYGLPSMNKKFNIFRQLLHAASIEFLHPCTQKPLLIQAPLPQDMLQFTKSVSGGYSQ